MRKRIVIFALAVMLFLTAGEKMMTSVKSAFGLDSSTVYVNQDRLFEKLSIEYYGVPDFAVELELINRQIKNRDIGKLENVDLIIPSRKAIERLKYKQTVTSLKIDSNPKLKQENSSEIMNPKFNSSPQVTDLQKSSALLIILAVISFSIVLGFVTELLRRLRNGPDNESQRVERKTIVSDDSILLDFDIISFEKKTDTKEQI